jgi:hypothetical protein
MGRAIQYPDCPNKDNNKWFIMYNIKMIRQSI